MLTTFSYRPTRWRNTAKDSFKLAGGMPERSGMPMTRTLSPGQMSRPCRSFVLRCGIQWPSCSGSENQSGSDAYDCNSEQYQRTASASVIDRLSARDNTVSPNFPRNAGYASRLPCFKNVAHGQHTSHRRTTAVPRSCGTVPSSPARRRLKQTRLDIAKQR